MIFSSLCSSDHSSCPPSGTETFFLWGPRQAGKSTLLREHYRDERWIDLLKSDEFRRYATRPELLRQELEAAGDQRGRQVVIDEIQKVPALLDEVHWLIENRGMHFALCGSSARKVRRGGANLLGGRAVRYELRGLTVSDIVWCLEYQIEPAYHEPDSVFDGIDAPEGVHRFPLNPPWGWNQYDIR